MIKELEKKKEHKVYFVRAGEQDLDRRETARIMQTTRRFKDFISQFSLYAVSDPDWIFLWPFPKPEDSDSNENKFVESDRTHNAWSGRPSGLSTVRVFQITRLVNIDNAQARVEIKRHDESIAINWHWRLTFIGVLRSHIRSNYQWLTEMTLNPLHKLKACLQWVTALAVGVDFGACPETSRPDHDFGSRSEFKQDQQILYREFLYSFLRLNITLKKRFNSY